MMTNSTYAHAVQNLNWFPKQNWRQWNKDGEPVVSFKSVDDSNYRKMLRLIETTRYEILATPRIDMPNAISIDGRFRQILPVPIPQKLPELTAVVFPDSVVELQWPSSAETYGLTFHLYRNGQPITETTAFKFTDLAATIGINCYTLILKNNSGKKSNPIKLEVNVPRPVLQQEIVDFTAESLSGCVRLNWNNDNNNSKPADFFNRYQILRSEHKIENGEEQWKILTPEPISAITFTDTSGEPEKSYRYRIRPVSRRGEFDNYSDIIEIASKSVPKIILFESALKSDVKNDTKSDLANGITNDVSNKPIARLSDGSTIIGTLQGSAKLTVESLTIPAEGQLVFPNRPEYNLDKQLTVDFKVKIEGETKMPVLISFGRWGDSGWFVQNIDNRWRWFLNGSYCDGGAVSTGQWTHLVCQYDGKSLRIIQDGKTVAEQTVQLRKTPTWRGSLVIGNYSAETGKPYQLKGCISNVRITNYVE
jgi:hypothetical protein